MQPRLVNFLACPDCHCEELRIRVTKEHACNSRQPEIEEGSLICVRCNEAYSIKAGIPRMLPKDLREPTLKAGNEGVEGTLNTAQGYDAHHLRQALGHSRGGVALKGIAADIVRAHENFREYLALTVKDLQSLKGQVVLDAGCGGGRFMAVVRDCGAADIVGLDISEGGLLHAKALLGRDGRVHLVQGDIIRPPFRPGIFGFIYSIGVLHHLVNPKEGFHALETLLSLGGRLWIWVYGLEGMSLVYRLSHLVWLRRLTRRGSLEAKFRLCQWVALAFLVSYLYPLRLIQRLPLVNVHRLPYSEWRNFSHEDVAYALFDRLHPPYTHYLRKTELEEWLSGLGKFSIENQNKRGWVAKGLRTEGEAPAQE